MNDDSFDTIIEKTIKNENHPNREVLVRLPALDWSLRCFL